MKFYLFIGVSLVVLTLLTNFFFVYGILNKECIVVYQELTYCSDKITQSRLYDNTINEVEQSIGQEEILINQEIAVSDEQPQLQFYTNKTAHMIWDRIIPQKPATNKSDILNYMSEKNLSYYLVIFATNNTIDNLQPEFTWVKTYTSEYKTLMLFKRNDFDETII